MLLLSEVVEVYALEEPTSQPGPPPQPTCRVSPSKVHEVIEPLTRVKFPESSERNPYVFVGGLNQIVEEGKTGANGKGTPKEGIPSERLAVSPFDKNSVPVKFDVSKLKVTVPVTLVQLLALHMPEKLVKGWPT
jgi:hypothetical protein